MSIVITTPTGNIGSSLVQSLLSANAELTLLVRDPSNLSDAVRQATTVKQGDLSDPKFVRGATEGADALFWLSPPEPDRSRHKGILWGALYCGVGGGKSQSNTTDRSYQWWRGWQTRRRNGFSAVETEDALNAAGGNVLSLRCGYFMENFLTHLPTLKSDGVWYGSNRPELPVPFVATRDIAAVAAEKLLDRDWKGQNFLAVHGAADITFAEAANILTEVTGKDIRYVQVPAEGVKQSLLGMGASADAAENLVTMFRHSSPDPMPLSHALLKPQRPRHWRNGSRSSEAAPSGKNLGFLRRTTVQNSGSRRY
jgi:uncharacterized protein YbjT (DUF2867 family)